MVYVKNLRSLILVVVLIMTSSCVTTSLENSGLGKLGSSNVLIKYKIGFATDIESGCVLTYERDGGDERFEMVFKGESGYYVTQLPPGIYRARNIRCVGSGRTSTSNFSWLDLRVHPNGLSYFSELHFENKFEKGQHIFVTGFEVETLSELRAFYQKLSRSDQERLISPISGKKITGKIVNHSGDKAFSYTYPKNLSPVELKRIQECVDTEVKENRFILGLLEVECAEQKSCSKYKIKSNDTTGTNQFEVCLKAGL